MKNTLLFALLGISLFSIGCSSAYKSIQTVDDVYYSPGRPSEERVDVKKDEEKKQQYQEYISSTDDRYLRMKVSNYTRWYALDDYNYWNDSRYDFYGYNYYNNGWNNRYYNNNYNNNWNYALGKGMYRPGSGWGPSYTIITYYGGKSVNPGTTSGSAITAYKNKNYNNSNGDQFYNPKTGVTSIIGNNNSSNFSNLVKRVFTSSSATSNGGSYDRAVRSFDNNSSSNSSNNTYSTPAPTTSSSAGGNSGGVSSTGSSSSGGRVIRN